MATKAPAKKAAKAPAKKAPAKAPAKKAAKKKASGDASEVPSPYLNGGGDLGVPGWSYSNRPFRRVRGGELSAIAREVRKVRFNTPISSPSGQIQTITKYARELGCTIQSVVDHEGPKDEDGHPLNRIWIKKDPAGDGAIPDMV